MGLFSGLANILVGDGGKAERAQNAANDQNQRLARDQMALQRQAALDAQRQQSPYAALGAPAAAQLRAALTGRDERYVDPNFEDYSSEAARQVDEQNAATLRSMGYGAQADNLQYDQQGRIVNPYAGNPASYEYVAFQKAADRLQQRPEMTYRNTITGEMTTAPPTMTASPQSFESAYTLDDRNRQIDALLASRAALGEELGAGRAAGGAEYNRDMQSTLGEMAAARATRDAAPGQFRYQADPGFQFMQGEAMRELNNQLGARGKYFNARAVEESVNNENNRLLAAEYDKLYNRYLGEADSRYGRAGEALGQRSGYYGNRLSEAENAYQRGLSEGTNIYNVRAGEAGSRYGLGTDAGNQRFARLTGLAAMGQGAGGAIGNAGLSSANAQGATAQAQMGLNQAYAQNMGQIAQAPMQNFLGAAGAAIGLAGLFAGGKKPADGGGLAAGSGSPSATGFNTGPMRTKTAAGSFSLGQSGLGT